MPSSSGAGSASRVGRVSGIAGRAGGRGSSSACRRMIGRGLAGCAIWLTPAVAACDRAGTAGGSDRAGPPPNPRDGNEGTVPPNGSIGAPPMIGPQPPPGHSAPERAGRIAIHATAPNETRKASAALRMRVSCGKHGREMWVGPSGIKRQVAAASLRAGTAEKEAALLPGLSCATGRNHSKAAPRGEEQIHGEQARCTNYKRPATNYKSAGWPSH